MYKKRHLQKILDNHHATISCDSQTEWKKAGGTSLDSVTGACLVTAGYLASHADGSRTKMSLSSSSSRIISQLQVDTTTPDTPDTSSLRLGDTDPCMTSDKCVEEAGGGETDDADSACQMDEDGDEEDSKSSISSTAMHSDDYEDSCLKLAFIEAADIISGGTPQASSKSSPTLTLPQQGDLPDNKITDDNNNNNTSYNTNCFRDTNDVYLSMIRARDQHVEDDNNNNENNNNNSLMPAFLPIFADAALEADIDANDSREMLLSDLIRIPSHTPFSNLSDQDDDYKFCNDLGLGFVGGMTSCLIDQPMGHDSTSSDVLDLSMTRPVFSSCRHTPSSFYPSATLNPHPNSYLHDNTQQSMLSPPLILSPVNCHQPVYKPPHVLTVRRACCSDKRLHKMHGQGQGHMTAAASKCSPRAVNTSIKLPWLHQCRSYVTGDDNNMTTHHTPVSPTTPGSRLGGVKVMTLSRAVARRVSVPSRPRVTHPGCSTIKYNRKNNPDLEKRRVHYCQFEGTVFISARITLYALYLGQ
jgi:hypothetical protein